MKTCALICGMLCLILLAAGCGSEAMPAVMPPAPSTPTPAAAPVEMAVPVTATPEETVAPTAQSGAAEPAQAGGDIDSQALAELAQIVEGYAADGKVVGAELAVIKGRQVVLHEAYGWNDKENDIPLKTGSLYNIRSMTKPVIGTVTLMLAEEGRLALDDHVADYLPAFDSDKSRDITVKHLLTHRSGLPLSLVLTGFEGYPSLRTIADAAGERGPDFTPGSAFQYSDTGTDVLGALIEVITGASLDQVLRERVLVPLQMAETLTVFEKDDPLASRIASAYIGGPGSWTQYWRAGEDPIYPYAMGSQSLYSTLLDYARFLALWMDGGQANGQRFLRESTVEQALAPVSDSQMPGAFPGLRLDYGQLWIVYVPEDAAGGAGEMALFGHSGSDGTWAWAWPDRDLMVLYFTQSRGQGTGIGLEADLDRLLIHLEAGPVQAAVPAELKPYLGSYVAASGPLMLRPFEILLRNGKLAVNVPEQIVVELRDPDEDGLWRLTVDPTIAVSFVRDETGEVVALNWHQGGKTFEIPRGEMPDEEPLDLATVQKYLGLYDRPEDPDSDPVEVLVHNGRLAVKIPEVIVILELFPPDEDGRWIMRLNPSVSLSFQEDEMERVVSFTSHSPEGDFVRPRVNE